MLVTGFDFTKQYAHIRSGTSGNDVGVGDVLDLVTVSALQYVASRGAKCGVRGRFGCGVARGQRCLYAVGNRAGVVDEHLGLQ